VPFRIKDLLINVSSGAEAKRRFGAAWSGLICECDGTLFCPDSETNRTVWSLLCCTRSRVAGPVRVGPGDPVESLEQLASLKADLKAALQEIERQEAAAAEAMKPQSLAEIEECEGKLRAGLAELERLKSELKGK